MLLSAQIYLMNALNNLFAATDATNGLTQLGTKLMEIVRDLLSPAITIGAAIASAMCLFYVIKAIAGDEQDVKSSIRRAKITVVILVILVLFKVIMNFILGAVDAGVTL